MPLTDIAGVKTDADRLHIISDHIHSVTKIAPTGSAPITLTGGAQWVLGAYGSDLLAADAVSNVFDIHHMIVSAPDDNADYEIAIFGGDTEIGRVAFTKTNNFLSSIQLPLVTPLQAAGTQIRAKLLSGDTGGESTAGIKIAYHEY